MSWQKLVNRASYALCMASIVAGVVSALALIWGSDEYEEAAARAMATAGVLFLAGLAVVAVNSALARSITDRKES